MSSESGYIELRNVLTQNLTKVVDTYREEREKMVVFISDCEG